MLNTKLNNFLIPGMLSLHFAASAFGHSPFEHLQSDEYCATYVTGPGHLYTDSITRQMCGIIGANSAPIHRGADTSPPHLRQVQAFIAKGAKARFGRAWDCTTFFTIPILSGLFVSALMLFILVISVLMLANIRSVDRFDDPHGPLLMAHVPTND